MAHAAVYGVLSVDAGLIVPYDDLVVATWDAARSGIALAVAVEPGVVLLPEGMKFEGVSTIVTFEDTPEA